MPGPLPAPAPYVSNEAKPFWDATAEGRLLLQRCPSCGIHIYYPRFVCPSCHAHELAYVDASGKGTVYSATLTTTGILDYKDCGPYVLAMVELEEGPKMMTILVEVEPDDVAIGMPVEVVFHDTGAGSALPRVRPAES